MTATDRTPIDRDEPCVCGCAAAWPLDDGSTECPRCGRVDPDKWVIAHE